MASGYLELAIKVQLHYDFTHGGIAITDRSQQFQQKVSQTVSQSVRVPSNVTQAWRKAMKARKNAYAPYSKFLVGAALIDERGRTFAGCNVENASYGATICAERNAVLAAVADGAREIKDVIVVTKMNPPAEPCAMCLQVLGEFSNEETRVWLADLNGIKEVAGFHTLLPRHFGPRSLKRGLKSKRGNSKR